MFAKWCKNLDTRAIVEAEVAERREVRRLVKDNWTSESWEALRAAWKGVHTAIIDDGVHAHLERYVATLEAIYKDRNMTGLLIQTPQASGGSSRKVIGGGRSSSRTRTVFY